MQSNPKPISQTPTDSPLSRAAHRLVQGIARHWLALFNLAWAVYILLPFLAPILMHLGWTTPARLIYAVYSMLCHQLPERSYFLFGNNLTPSLAALEAAGMESGPSLFAQRSFIGAADVGYKIAICQRDIAIYGAVLVGGLLFGLLRRRLHGLSLRWYLLLLVPIALDGLTQLVGLRESNWWLRSVTGILFGIGSVWLAYPYIDDAMQDVIESEAQRQKPSFTQA